MAALQVERDLRETKEIEEMEAKLMAAGPKMLTSLGRQNLDIQFDEWKQAQKQYLEARNRLARCGIKTRQLQVALQTAEGEKKTALQQKYDIALREQKEASAAHQDAQRILLERKTTLLQSFDEIDKSYLARTKTIPELEQKIEFQQRILEIAAMAHLEATKEIKNEQDKQQKSTQFRTELQGCLKASEEEKQRFLAKYSLESPKLEEFIKLKKAREAFGLRVS